MLEVGKAICRVVAAAYVQSNNGETVKMRTSCKERGFWKLDAAKDSFYCLHASVFFFN